MRYASAMNSDCARHSVPVSERKPKVALSCAISVTLARAASGERAVGQRDQAGAARDGGIGQFQRLARIGVERHGHDHVARRHGAQLAHLHRAQAVQPVHGLGRVLQRIGQVGAHGKGPPRGREPERGRGREQIHRRVDGRIGQPGLQRLQAGEAAFDHLVRDLRARQRPHARVDQAADAVLVVALRRELARRPGAKQRLELRVAMEAEVLGEAHHGRGLHAAILRHLLNALQRDVRAAVLHVARDGLQLAAEARVLGAQVGQEGIRAGIGGVRGWMFFSVFH